MQSPQLRDIITFLTGVPHKKLSNTASLQVPISPPTKNLIFRCIIRETKRSSFKAEGCLIH